MVVRIAFISCFSLSVNRTSNSNRPNTSCLFYESLRFSAPLQIMSFTTKKGGIPKQRYLLAELQPNEVSISVNTDKLGGATFLKLMLFLLGMSISKT